MKNHNKKYLAVSLFFVAIFFSKIVSGETPGFTYVRIYTDESGASHFSDESLELALINPGKNIQPTPATVPFGANGFIILCPNAGEEVDWHPAPRNQFNIILNGIFEVEVSDGEIRQFRAGSVILLEDVEGKGHRTRIIGETRACFGGVSLAIQ